MAKPRKSGAVRGRGRARRKKKNIADSSPALLFGDIAIESGFLTPEQVDEAVRAQLDGDDPLPLGEILLRQGQLEPEKLRKVLEMQAERLRASAETTILNLGESLFGRKAIEMGLASEEAVDAAVREQTLRRGKGEQIRLGQILVDHDTLSPDQVREILQRQNREVLFCPACYSQYNILGFDPGWTFPCQSCKTELKVPTPNEDPFQTTSRFGTPHEGIDDGTEETTGPGD